MKDIVIELRGGVLVEVYASDLDTRVIVIDWDRAEERKDRERAGFKWSPCQPLCSLPDDTREEYVHAASAN